MLLWGETQPCGDLWLVSACSCSGPWDLGFEKPDSPYHCFRELHTGLQILWPESLGSPRFKIRFYVSLIFLYLLISFACELSLPPSLFFPPPPSTPPLLILSHVYTHRLRAYSKKCVIRWVLLSWKQHSLYFTSLSVVGLVTLPGPLVTDKLGHWESGMDQYQLLTSSIT